MVNQRAFPRAGNARDNFEHDNAKLRREIAGRLGVKYCLTLDKLEIEPDPLLVPILAFEPLKDSSGNKKDGSHEAVRLSWLALWDDVRTCAWEHKGHFPRIQ